MRKLFIPAALSLSLAFSGVTPAAASGDNDTIGKVVGGLFGLAVLGALIHELDDDDDRRHQPVIERDRPPREHTHRRTKPKTHYHYHKHYKPKPTYRPHGYYKPKHYYHPPVRKPHVHKRHVHPRPHWKTQRPAARPVHKHGHGKHAYWHRHSLSHNHKAHGHRH